MSNWSYIVLLGAFVLVFALLVPRKKQTTSDSNQAVRNMEIALDQFMGNMELDNQELVKLITVLREEGLSQTAMKEQRIGELERKIDQLELQMEQHRLSSKASVVELERMSSTVASISSATTAVAEPVVIQDAPQPQAPHTIKMRYAELLQLYNEGKSIEAIAKKMNMNKGEVQLILQLVKQEEGVRA